MTIFKATLFMAVLCTMLLHTSGTSVQRIVHQADTTSDDGGNTPDASTDGDSEGAATGGLSDPFDIQAALMPIIAAQVPTCIQEQKKYVCVPCASPLVPFPCLAFCGVTNLPCPKFGEATCSNERYCFYEVLGSSYVNPSCKCVPVPEGPTDDQ